MRKRAKEVERLKEGKRTIEERELGNYVRLAEMMVEAVEKKVATAPVRRDKKESEVVEVNEAVKALEVEVAKAVEVEAAKLVPNRVDLHQSDRGTPSPARA